MHLPPTPSDDVLREALPWWGRTLMLEAHKLGIQHHAAKVVKEVWRLQDVVPWTHEDVPAVVEDAPAEWTADYPQPSEEVLTEFWTWAAVAIESYGAEQNWCDLFGKLAHATWQTTEQNVYINDGYGVDGFGPDGLHRNGHDQEGKIHRGVSTKVGPPPWINVTRARKW